LRSSDRYGWWHSAADALVNRARRDGLAGATVLCGIHGLDAAGALLESSDWHITERLPVIVEFVDRPAAIGAFLPIVSEIVAEGLATLERGHVLLYRSQPSPRQDLAIPPPIESFSALPNPEEFPAMTLGEDGQLLRVFCGESDRWEGEPLYAEIVKQARTLGLAGATVLRGAMGFGANSHLHTAKILRLSNDLPIIIEIVDTEEKLNLLLPHLDEMVQEGLVTLEAVRVLKYRANQEKTK
jgi:PII-like signaling protein